MSLIVKNESGPREKPLLGMHDAICCFVEDIGTHLIKTGFGDKLQHKVVIIWEIDENIKEGKYAGKPFMVSKQYTFTLFEKGNLSKDLESWFAKKISEETRKTGFDLKTLVGRKCQINLIESDDGQYINIGSVLPPSKNNILTQVVYECPEWVTKKRAQSIEANQQQPGQDPNEPLPEYHDQDVPPLPF